MRRTARAAGLVVALLLAASAARAQERSVEAEGAVPVPAGAWSAPTLRGQAQEAALREALVQVAVSIATPPAPSGSPPPGAAPAPAPSAPSSGPASGPGAADGALLERMRTAFQGAAPLDFAARYRVVQDIGVRPRTLLQDPSVAQEYAVRVEAQIDSARVRRKLAAAGLLPAAAAAAAPVVGGSSFVVVVDGIPSPGAYAAVRRAIAERAQTRSVLPTTVSAREVTFDVSGARTGPDPGATLRGPAGSALWLEPVPGAEPGAPLRLRVTSPPPISAGAAAEPAPGSVPPSAKPAASVPSTSPPSAGPPTAGPRPASVPPARSEAAPGSVPPSTGPTGPSPPPGPRPASAPPARSEAAPGSVPPSAGPTGPSPPPAKPLPAPARD